MKHIAFPLSNDLMTRSGLQPNFLTVELCWEMRLSLVTCGETLGRGFLVCSKSRVRLVEFGFGGIQLEGLQCVERLEVRS